MLFNQISSTLNKLYDPDLKYHYFILLDHWMQSSLDLEYTYVQNVQGSVLSSSSSEVDCFLELLLIFTLLNFLVFCTFLYTTALLSLTGVVYKIFCGVDHLFSFLLLFLCLLSSVYREKCDFAIVPFFCCFFNLLNFLQKWNSIGKNLNDCQS